MGVWLVYDDYQILRKLHLRPLLVRDFWACCLFHPRYLIDSENDDLQWICYR